MKKIIAFVLILFLSGFVSADCYHWTTYMRITNDSAHPAIGWGYLDAEICSLTPFNCSTLAGTMANFSVDVDITIYNYSAVFPTAGSFTANTFSVNMFQTKEITDTIPLNFPPNSTEWKNVFQLTPNQGDFYNTTATATERHFGWNWVPASSYCDSTVWGKSPYIMGLSITPDSGGPYTMNMWTDNYTQDRR